MSIAAAPSVSISKRDFGLTAGGASVDLFTLHNSRGMEARICTYGGIVTTLTAPDRSGEYSDVILGYDSLDKYLENTPYFGAIIGRYGNRIAKGRFRLDGRNFSLARNDGENALHGGQQGFDKVVWQVESFGQSARGPTLILSYLSKDGEEGYPGNLDVVAVYTLTDDNELWVDFEATTDRITIVNLTHHLYFNLRCRDDILGHQLQINASRYTPVTAELIPTGELRAVAGTPFDFREARRIGEQIDCSDEQIGLAHGYDHNWVIDAAPGVLSRSATVHEPESGRLLDVFSTQPGLQFYTGNFLDGTILGKQGWCYQRHSGFCLEPQHFPDSPNRAEFPTVVLRPGRKYKSTIGYRFTARS